jgi:hypothetical protein
LGELYTAAGPVLNMALSKTGKLSNFL